MPKAPVLPPTCVEEGGVCAAARGPPPPVGGGERLEAPRGVAECGRGWFAGQVSPRVAATLRPRYNSSNTPESTMPKAPVLPLICVEEGGLAAANLSATHAAWAQANGFSGQRG